MNLASFRSYVTFVGLLLSACDKPPQTSPRIDALEKKISDLEQRIKSEEHETSELSLDLFKLRLDFQERIEALKERTTTIDPNSTGYSFLDTGGGVILISCDGAEPYLDGHRIKLRLGNPLNMRFSGFKLKFKFGRKPPNPPTIKGMNGSDFVKAGEAWQRDYDAWKESLRSAEGSYTVDLSPGAWRTVQATLPQTMAADLAYVEVSIETGTISLRAP